MTPAEKLGCKIGDRFVATGSKAFADGSIIELEYDDGTRSPLFRLINGSFSYNILSDGFAGAYCSLNFVKKIEENKMTAHKHAEMIKAKADNMELVVFCKDRYDDANKWQETSQMPFQEEFDYFLCLPQHKEACLHWLNGGDVEHKTLSEPAKHFLYYWEVLPGCEDFTWSNDCVWVFWSEYIRIKPRKEKLWIAVKTDKHEHLGGCREVRICSHAFVNKSDAEEYLDLSDSQLIEIEVEV